MNHEMRLAAIGELLEAEGIDVTINLLADKIQETIGGSVDDIDRVQRAGRAYALRNITRSAQDVLLHDENPCCDFCSQRKPKSQVGTIRGIGRCHECESKDESGDHNEANSQYAMSL